VLSSGGVATTDLWMSGTPMDMVGDLDGVVAMGKRYVDDSDTFEVLRTEPGTGDLAIDGRPLHLKNAKPLHSSDRDPWPGATLGSLDPVGLFPRCSHPLLPNHPAISPDSEVNWGGLWWECHIPILQASLFPNAMWC